MLAATRTEEQNVLVLGSGAREHALAWKIAQSPRVEKVFVAPGNGGTHSNNILNLDLNLQDHERLVHVCKKNAVDLVVVGPEAPLAEGIVDRMHEIGIPCFGPSKKASQLECSKLFAKQFMDRHGIPTARWRSFTNVDEADSFIKSSDWPAFVVKVSGLAAGKGVVVAKDRTEACEAVRHALVDHRFGDAGKTVIVEERLNGFEVSCLALSDGSSIVCLPPVQDYKRLQDFDQGPNTGGMGAYSPVPFLSEVQQNFIKRHILKKTIDHMREDGVPYKGVLYAGLMVNGDDVNVLEFNCRFGDPETQVLMALLEKSCDLYTALESCVNGSLNDEHVKFTRNKHAVCIVCASEGYPGAYEKGKPITGLAKAKNNVIIQDSNTGKVDTLEIFHAGTSLRKDDQVLITSGGRVLSVVATADDMVSARIGALSATSIIQYEGKVYRNDIATSAIRKLMRGMKEEAKVVVNGTEERSLTYSSCGVNVQTGEDFVEAIKPMAKETQIPGCITGIGGFGGVFSVAGQGYSEPYLVSGTDGVGSKLKIAQEYEKHDTIGIDLVAMCVNDILCHGAEPKFFLDYLATGKLNIRTAVEIMEGITTGCKEAKCALLGGETAEVPGIYEPGVYDLAGFAVGIVERANMLPRYGDISEGDVIVGLASTGIHSNGVSLVRRVVSVCGLEYSMPCPWNSEQTLGEALLTPTRIYIQAVLPIMASGRILGAAHITGGGLPGNVCRILTEGLAARLDASCWNIHPVFKWIAKNGGVAANEMARTFNLGIGMTLIVSKEEASNICEELCQAGVQTSIIGIVHKAKIGDTQVKIENLDKALEITELPKTIDTAVVKCRVAVLISGTGSNLQALIENAIKSKGVHYEIVLVISNRRDAYGLIRAETAGIPTKVIEHNKFKSREEFDDCINEELLKAEVQLVCLAGFMRILSGKFVRAWRGRLLNIHPSLLPAFRGMDAHKQALAAGVTLTGCTVHFVEEEVDAGAIIVQEAVPVLPGEFVAELTERVKEVEHKAYPRALELVASGGAALGEDGRILWKK